MRCFIAIPFPDAVKASLLDCMQQLQRQTQSANLTRPENLHLTLAFLGETDRIAPIQAAMRAAAPDRPFSMALAGSGCFQALWWVGLQRNPILIKLAERLQNELRARGFSLERRPFRPHITIARQVEAEAPISLAVPSTSMLVDRICLMKSHRVADKLVYTPLYQNHFPNKQEGCKKDGI